MKVFPKGSEWRKWDLHVHTPASVLRNEFGGNWDDYVTLLFKKAIEENISAIGITDYYLPEGYRIIKNDYLQNTEKMKSLFSKEEIDKISKIFVFPNIEFRLSKLVIGKQNDLAWNRKLNYHIILSDEIPPEKIESDLISQIKISFDASTGSNVQKKPLTKSNLEEFGKKLIEEHLSFASAGTPLWVGMLNASVDEEEVIKILNENSLFRDSFLIGLPADEDLSEVSWNSQGHAIRKNLIKQSHFIFSSNPKTCQFLLGSNDKESFIKEFGAQKPCMWGSDAHKKEELFLPAERRNTWIKADLSFEGLRQVIFDPESRVRIQELSPQQKNTYQIIDSVRFVDTKKTNRFSNEWQSLNPDLNTIIGGKSSGKSLLLYHIAKAVNSREVQEKTELARATTYSDLDGIDFEVRWGNGEISKLSESSDEKQITYIPQLYINHLAEEDGRDQLNKLIKSLLSQNNSFKDFSREKEKEISENNKQISEKIDRIFILREQHAELAKECANFGTKLAVELEIDRITKIISELRNKSGFTEEQEQKYSTLSRRKEMLQYRSEVLEKIRTCGEQVITSTKSRIDAILETFHNLIMEDVDAPKSSSYLKHLFKNLDAEIGIAASKFIADIEIKSIKIPAHLEKIGSQLNNINTELTPLIEKVDDQKSLELFNGQLQAEQEKQKKINDIEIKQDALKKAEQECKKEIAELYDKILKEYKDYVTIVSSPEFQIENNLRISASLGFNEDKFNEFVKSFDGRANLKTLLGQLTTNEGVFNFDIEKHSQSISEVFEKLDNKAAVPPLRKGVETKDLVARLFSDCFFISYTVQYRGDDIVRMSPGKRGLVLLNLILHLSNATHPILIDQPEDNLDNRTIYDQLNDFIRKRKDKRQIIMVTHNANLVVAADSECVIVANQSGQQSDIENKEFKFEYFSGSLELSFEDKENESILYKKGIRQHVCEILEGGIQAFKERELKYGFRF
ncbi:TrlF family AAA-like ATPase [Chitiniphilus eburneus]|uniref:TrlF family AAA-like ATPase n=1 Tax=Chitiniphilus eburneus TaxID=2571148 RepID=UPI0035D0BC2E